MPRVPPLSVNRGSCNKGCFVPIDCGPALFERDNEPAGFEAVGLFGYQEMEFQRRGSFDDMATRV